MPSERIEKRIDQLLDEADVAAETSDWQRVLERARAVLAVDSENADAKALLAMSEELHSDVSSDRGGSDADIVDTPPSAPPTSVEAPTSFANGRYEVKSLLGESGKKKVYLAPQGSYEGGSFHNHRRDACKDRTPAQ